jgi:hypothetical protein
MIKRGGKDGQPEFWRVFIHLHRYPESDNGEYFQQQISEGKTVTIVYDDPWYWKVSMSRISKPKGASQRVQRPRPYIACEGSGNDKTSPRARTSPPQSPSSAQAKASNNVVAAAETFCEP